MKATSFSRKGVWLRSGIVPWKLTGSDLALALLIYQQPRTLPQLCAQLSANVPTMDRKELLKRLARLTSRGVLTESGGVYACNCKKLARFNSMYTESQLLDLVGLTQNTAGGRAFYTSAPPMSASSGNASMT